MAKDRNDILRECRITVFRSGGPGGQRRNKVATAVRIQHLPTGLVVIGRRHRELSRNRRDCEERLVERLRELGRKPRPRKPSRPSARSREERLRAKRRRGRLKELRRPVASAGDA